MAKYSIQQLSEKADVTIRNIRYYIGQGLMPGAVGKTKRAHYTKVHLDRLKLIRELQDRGLSLSEIKNKFKDPNKSILTNFDVSLTPAGETWVHHHISPDVCVMVRQGTNPKPILKALKKAIKEDKS